MQFSLKTLALTLFTALVGVHAESHTVHFTNNCGRGTPTLVQSGVILSTGGDYTHNGPLPAMIAYLQTGSCGLNGEGCTLVEVTLQNPTTPGGGSSADISLLSPHTFSVTSGFGYYNGCDGTGADCTSASCPDQWPVQVACQVDNCNIAITFCD